MDRWAISFMEAYSTVWSDYTNPYDYGQVFLQVSSQQIGDVRGAGIVVRLAVGRHDGHSKLLSGFTAAGWRVGQIWDMSKC